LRSTISLVFRSLSSPQDKKATIDEELDEFCGVRPTPVRIHFEFCAESIHDLTGGPRPIGELDDPLSDVRQFSGLVFEGMKKVIRAGDEEAVVDALESRIGMSLNERGPEPGAALLGAHTGSGAIGNRLIQAG
jgi:hypothetical protein